MLKLLNYYKEMKTTIKTSFPQNGTEANLINSGKVNTIDDFLNWLVTDVHHPHFFFSSFREEIREKLQELTKTSDSVSLVELKEKLNSLRYTKEQVEYADELSGYMIAGWTLCVDSLLTWVKKKQDGK